MKIGKWNIRNFIEKAICYPTQEWAIVSFFFLGWGGGVGVGVKGADIVYRIRASAKVELYIAGLFWVWLF